MRIELVEIYSDETNAAIMRHPGRRFPGVLIQGDTLASLCADVRRVVAIACPHLDSDGQFELYDLQERLAEFLEHYKRVLRQHGLPLPFVDLQ
jgi:predicted RNase H-like HicB family nuclease